jgi:hypothetical protein
MILKVSQKVNSCGWRRQLIIDFEKKTAKKGAFLFHSGDVDDLSAKQYKQYLDFLKYNDFEIMEG